MQVFVQGKEVQWGHINYTVEYETTRDGSKLGIRWKLTWAIDNGYYFGYNIIADVYTEGNNYGGQIKANSPNRGSGVTYFPSETEYFWFDKGYGSNQINGCRIIFKSTNGGSVTFDSGTEKTVTTPVGYIASTINSNIDFNIGNDLNISISDITNVNYNYKVYLDMYVNNVWKSIKEEDITSKNFTLDLANLANNLYNLLPNNNSAKIRVNLCTYIGTTLLGMTTKEGTCYIKNSNPETPVFGIFGMRGGTSIDDELSDIVAGFGPFGNLSDAHIAIKDISLSAKNGATLKKVIIEWNGKIEEVLL